VNKRKKGRLRNLATYYNGLGFIESERVEKVGRKGDDRNNLDHTTLACWGASIDLVISTEFLAWRVG
jgi:hypothetical protein